VGNGGKNSVAHVERHVMPNAQLWHVPCDRLDLDSIAKEVVGGVVAVQVELVHVTCSCNSYPSSTVRGRITTQLRRVLSSIRDCPTCYACGDVAPAHVSYVGCIVSQCEYAVSYADLAGLSSAHRPTSADHVAHRGV